MNSIYTYLYKFVINKRTDEKFLKMTGLVGYDLKVLEEKAYVLNAIVWSSAIFEMIRRYTYSRKQDKVIEFKKIRDNFYSGYSSGIGVFGALGEVIEKCINRYLQSLFCYEGFKISKENSFQFGRNSGVVGLLLGHGADVLDINNKLYNYKKDFTDKKGIILETVPVFDKVLYKQNHNIFPVKKLNIELKRIDDILGPNLLEPRLDPRIKLINHDVPSYFLPNVDYKTLGLLIVYYALKPTQINAVGLKDRHKKRIYLTTIREFNRKYAHELSSMKARFILSGFYKKKDKKLTSISRLRILLFIHSRFSRLFRNRDYEKIIDTVREAGYELTVGEVVQYLIEIYANSKKKRKEQV